MVRRDSSSLPQLQSFHDNNNNKAEDSEQNGDRSDQESYVRLSEDEIKRLIHLRARHRIQGEWKLADEIKDQLWDAGMEVMDTTDPMATAWIPRRDRESPKVVEWHALNVNDDSDADDSSLTSRDEHLLGEESQEEKLLFVVVTVNTPYYRKRYLDTLQHLEEWRGEADFVSMQKCDMLNLKDKPSVNSNGILMLGWKTILLPKLLQLYQGQDVDFVLIAEDDIRFPESTTPELLRRACRHMFATYPNIDILSLGHSWSNLGRDDRTLCDSSLLDFLQIKAAGIHATTLLALRFPRGIQALQLALDETMNHKLQHLDHFLFHSTRHDLAVALSDPPLAGWTEVEQSLTKSGTGHRRHGGGRLGRLPPSPRTKIRWVGRRRRDAAS